MYSGTYFDGKQFWDLGISAQGFIGANTPKSRIESFAWLSRFCSDTDIALEAAKWSAHGIEGNARKRLAFELEERGSQIIIPTLLVQGDKEVITHLIHVLQCLMMIFQMLS